VNKGKKMEDRRYDCLGGINKSHTRQIHQRKTNSVNMVKKMKEKGATTVLAELTNRMQDNSVIEKAAAQTRQKR
jgi:hypothetical protein